MTSRPRRTSSQPESRQHRPCWPWTQVRGSLSCPAHTPSCPRAQAGVLGPCGKGVLRPGTAGQSVSTEARVGWRRLGEGLWLLVWRHGAGCPVSRSQGPSELRAWAGPGRCCGQVRGRGGRASWVGARRSLSCRVRGPPSRGAWESGAQKVPSQLLPSVPSADGTAEKISHAKAVAREAQDTVARVQAQLKDMQRNVERWQGQFGGLQGQDLGRVVLDTGRSGEPAAVLERLGWGQEGQTLALPCRAPSVHPGEDPATAAGQAG